MLFHYWASLSENDKRLWQCTVLTGAVFLFHFAWYSTWYVEDAAISFAFAHNVANGEGFVGYPGGERVEGFSNPTWTLLLTAGEVVGLSSWYMAKLWGALLGLCGLPLAMRWVQYIRPNKTDLFPALAPLFLAFSPQYVMWAASGLENPLLAFLIVLGSVLLLREIHESRFPWSALVWSLVAISRPEAPLYAFVAGVTGGIMLIFSPKGFRRVLYWAPRWLAVCAAPFVLWHGWRWSYFAWEFPNTYYAKLDGNTRFRPWSWNIKRGGWHYLRSYALASGTGFWLGLYMLGQTGWGRYRRWLLILLFVIHILFLIPGLDWLRSIILAEPTWFAQLRIASLYATFVILPIIGWGRTGWRSRLLAYNLVGVVLFFTLYSGSDWMQGYRWLSFCAVPMAVLLTDALGLVSDRVRDARWFRLTISDSLRTWFVIRLPIAVVFTISLVTTIIYVNRLETSPFDVYRRVLYMQNVQKRLHLDHATLLEVDMGAHMWWSGFHLVDMAGLIDVPMGHHKWEKAFISEYVYQERNPEFAHVHGSWATKTRMKSHKEWKRYLQIHPYPINPGYHHGGNHIRKDLIIKENWIGPSGRQVSFAGGVELMGWDTPSDIAIPGQTLYLESGWRKTRNTPNFRVVAFISNGTDSVVRELPPAYDWYPPHRWKKNSEVVMAYHAFTLPQDLPTGDYDLGFFVYDLHGARAVVKQPAGTTILDPHHSKSEIRWENMIQVVPEVDGIGIAENALNQMVQLAQNGECTSAEGAWKRVRNVVTESHDKYTQWRLEYNNALAPCWSGAAIGATDLDEKRALLTRARKIHHRHPRVMADGHQIAQRHNAQAETARSHHHVEDEFNHLRVVITADPSRSWVRRRIEELRDVRLELNTP